jgi:phage terminase small subunit
VVPDVVPSDVTVPSPPEDLEADARPYWEVFAGILAGARLLTPADQQTLADYCRSCAHVAHLSHRVGVAWRKRTVDHRVIKGLDAQLRGWLDKKTKLASELGLTVIARTRLANRVPEPMVVRSPLATLQDRAAALGRPVGVP